MDSTNKKDELYFQMRKRANEINKKYYSKTQYAPRHMCQWTQEEDNILIEGAESEVILSNLLGRSVASIQKRRCMLRKQGYVI